MKNREIKRVCLRFSDHKGGTNVKWFNFADPDATYGSLIGFIKNGIRFAEKNSMRNCWKRIAS